ncbi:MAG: DUF1353 domain-containing protein [Planctomycetaceae bacterium]|nr:DUF1353 domain-containing protein [Planctomycetaceae bacterium]
MNRLLPLSMLLAMCCTAGCATSAAFPPESVPPHIVPVTPSLPVTPIQYPPEIPPNYDWGHFHGDLRLELVGGRDARLVSNFGYVDPHGTDWPAPRGSLVNGASIPQAFWSFVGGPWDGAYRQASVVHDVACDSMQATWQETHRMFYHACRCGGVEERTAKLMYWAVYHFGPRWEPQTVMTKELRVVDGNPTAVDVPKTTSQRVAMAPPTAAQLQHARAYFQQNSPDLDAIPSLQFAPQ